MLKSQKPATKAGKEDTLQTVLTTLVGMTVLLVGGVGVYWLFQPAPVVPMTVQVKIDNRCGLTNDAFMAVSEPDGARAHFSGDLALLDTRSNSRIYVRSSDNYPAWSYESPPAKAAEEVTIKTVCQTNHFHGSLDSLKKRFE